MSLCDGRDAVSRYHDLFAVCPTAVQGGDAEADGGDDACLADGLMSARATVDDSYLSSWVAARHQLGTARCPWHISADPGQSVLLTVLDFALSARYRAVWTTDHDAADTPPDVVPVEYCHVYATVRELPTRPDTGTAVSSGLGLAEMVLQHFCLRGTNCC